jgi:hypothetical protein
VQKHLQCFPKLLNISLDNLVRRKKTIRSVAMPNILTYIYSKWVTSRVTWYYICISDYSAEPHKGLLATWLAAQFACILALWTWRQTQYVLINLLNIYLNARRHILEDFRMQTCSFRIPKQRSVLFSALVFCFTILESITTFNKV